MGRKEQHQTKQKKQSMVQNTDQHNQPSVQNTDKQNPDKQKKSMVQ